jgi:hypothetical protein
MIGIIEIKMKIGVQWNRSQIRMWDRARLYFLTPMELYYDMNNTAVSKCPNS